MSKSSKCIGGFLSVISLFLSACVLPNGAGTAQSTSLKEGAYEGFIINSSKTASSELFLSGSLIVAKSGDFSIDLLQQYSPSKADAPASYNVKGLWKNNTVSISMTSSAGLTTTSNLSYDSKTKCFADKTSTLCSEGNEIRYETKEGDNGALLVLDQKTAGFADPKEKPKTYDISEIIEIAKKGNFNSQVAYMQWQVAKEQALEDHLKLLPSASFSDFLAIPTLNTSGLIHAVGDFAPFLLPSRWLEAAAGSAQADAELDAYKVMEADSASIAQGLAYNLLRDQQILATYQAYEQPIIILEKEILDRERLGLLPLGSAADLDSVLGTLKQSEAALVGAIASEKTGLGQAIGLTNPDNFLGINAPAQYPTIPESGDQVTIPGEDEVDTRSIELKEFRDLIRVANDDLDAGYFYFIDPSAGAGANIGPALPTAIEVAKMQIEEIDKEQNVEKSTLGVTLRGVVASVATQITTRNIDIANIQLQQQRIEQMSQQMALGTSVAVNNLEDAFENALKSESDRLSQEFGFYVTLGSLDRLDFSGPYADIPTSNDQQ